jgi:4-hydroxyphenylpyruvate dioxygenase-like putative hemolysin
MFLDTQSPADGQDRAAALYSSQVGTANKPVDDILTRSGLMEGQSMSSTCKVVLDINNTLEPSGK